MVRYWMKSCWYRPDLSRSEWEKLNPTHLTPSIQITQRKERILLYSLYFSSNSLPWDIRATANLGQQRSFLLRKNRVGSAYCFTSSPSPLHTISVTVFPFNTCIYALHLANLGLSEVMLFCYKAIIISISIPNNINNLSSLNSLTSTFTDYL